MGKNIFKALLPLAIATVVFSCKSFRHGYTWSKARNSYNLVTGDKSNFGDKRLDYNKAFHKNSALSSHLTCDCNTRGLPDFIYEYQTDTKCRGIKLFYVPLDSVFIFEEPKKNNFKSILKEARIMTDSERLTYDRIKLEK